jgi:hypothetical protein
MERINVSRTFKLVKLYTALPHCQQVSPYHVKFMGNHVERLKFGVIFCPSWEHFYH